MGIVRLGDGQNVHRNPQEATQRTFEVVDRETEVRRIDTLGVSDRKSVV